MQYLNDDMDELIRRAAENYPLDTSGANWDKVKNAMQEPVVTKKRNTSWIWIAAITIFWISNTFIAYREGFGDGKVSSQVQNSSIPNNSRSQTSSAPTITLRKQNSSNPTPLIDQRPVLIPATREMIFKKPAGSGISGSSFDKLSAKRSLAIVSGRMNNAGNPDIIDDSWNLRSHDELMKSGLYNSVTVSHLSFYTRSPLVSFKKTDESTAQQKKRGKASKKVYGSVIIGSDMNTVKMQSFSKPGITTGIKIGFQLNKWAIESGLLYDIKSYSSDGKYFDYKVYPNTKINSVSGTCNMFEWPVDIHYVFNPIGKHTFYISGGLSSYLMKKENYTYDYDWYGQPYYSNRTYKNSSNNFFSVINISAGYQFKIGRSSFMKFEPYGKLPLKGVGIGNLPLTSFGVNLVVSKDFLNK